MFHRMGSPIGYISSNNLELTLRERHLYIVTLNFVNVMQRSSLQDLS